MNQCLAIYKNLEEVLKDDRGEGKTKSEGDVHAVRVSDENIGNVGSENDNSKESHKNVE